MGRYSALSIYNKLMLYQQVLKPAIWAIYNHIQFEMFGYFVISRRSISFNFHSVEYERLIRNR
jgi:hypothetical protein